MAALAVRLPVLLTTGRFDGVALRAAIFAAGGLLLDVGADADADTEGVLRGLTAIAVYPRSSSLISVVISV
jgi:hypothetical protein